MSLTLEMPQLLNSLEEQLKEEPEIPCHIHPAWRKENCHTLEDHPAKVALLFQCGHAFHYCATAAPIMLQKMHQRRLTCTVCLKDSFDAVWVDLR